MNNLNFKHLYYFWVVAQEGSMTRAAERLDVAIQTISGQLSLLERQLGKSLFIAQGRGLALTESGRLALGYGYASAFQTASRNCSLIACFLRFTKCRLMFA